MAARPPNQKTTVIKPSNAKARRFVQNEPANIGAQSDINGNDNRACLIADDIAAELIELAEGTKKAAIKM